MQQFVSICKFEESTTEEKEGVKVSKFNKVDVLATKVPALSRFACTG